MTNVRGQWNRDVSLRGAGVDVCARFGWGRVRSGRVELSCVGLGIISCGWL